MKPWINRLDWFETYALRVALLKQANSELATDPIDTVVSTLRTSFEKVYRAVAFDIDGTLTLASGTDIDPRMAAIVSRLLQRGVPVILITGRGRPTTRNAALQIRKMSGIDDWYLRRLSCITHNGIFLLSTSSDSPNKFLHNEQIIAPSLSDSSAIINRLEKLVATEGIPSDQIIITAEPHSIRLVFNLLENRDKFKLALKPLFEELQALGKVYLSTGTYAQTFAIDLVCTNKQIALNHVAEQMGVTADRILRIGDQGQEDGNDYDLLDSEAGFSVGELSKKFDRCFPVLDDNLQKDLRGVDATTVLLNLICLFPPISILATNQQDRLSGLRKFERLALRRSRREAATAAQRLKIRLRYLLPQQTNNDDIDSIRIADIFDKKSGGVKFHDWDFDSISVDHPALILFGIKRSMQNGINPPNAAWCMFTDTGILMRGPMYYYGLTHDSSDQISHVRLYLETSCVFLTKAIQVVDYLLNDNVDFIRYKLLLAIQDNVRNLLLNILNTAFIAETSIGEINYAITKEIYVHGVGIHTTQHFNSLLNPDADWTTSLADYGEHLKMVADRIVGSSGPLLTKIEQMCEVSLSNGSKRPKLFGWRECDHFMENVAAVQLGLHELRQLSDVRNAKQLVMVGLASGGIELPAIAASVAAARGFNIVPAIAKISIYGDKDIGQKVRNGEHDYVSEMLRQAAPICLFDQNVEDAKRNLIDKKCILMDDNCTTGVTLQLARDVLVTLGSDVLGAIIVRFPSVNRQIQMSLPNHGFPDPEVLCGFVRGLIAPSPYARLLFPNDGDNPYLDQTGVFDKAKGRIIRYLLKNGTPATS